MTTTCLEGITLLEPEEGSGFVSGFVGGSTSGVLDSNSGTEEDIVNSYSF